MVHVYGTCIWYMYMDAYGICVWYMYMLMCMPTDSTYASEQLGLRRFFFGAIAPAAFFWIVSESYFSGRDFIDVSTSVLT